MEQPRGIKCWNIRSKKICGASLCLAWKLMVFGECLLIDYCCFHKRVRPEWLIPSSAETCQYNGTREFD